VHSLCTTAPTTQQQQQQPAQQQQQQRGYWFNFKKNNLNLSVVDQCREEETAA